MKLRAQKLLLCLVLFSSASCLPREGGFRVIGWLPEPSKTCHLDVFMAETREPFKSRLISSEFNEVFGTSADRSKYYFVINCDGTCFKSAPSLLGHMETIDLGTVSLAECSK